MTKKKEENVENNIVNEYEIQLGPVDHLGHKWAENLIKYTKLGAEVKKGSLIKATFPHHVWLTISTSEVLKNEPGVQVFRINETFTKEQLEVMEWSDFRDAVAQKRIRGRKRDDMMRAYLKATGQDQTLFLRTSLSLRVGLLKRLLKNLWKKLIRQKTLKIKLKKKKNNSKKLLTANQLVAYTMHIA